MILSHHSDKTGERRLHYIFNVTAGAAGLVLSGLCASNPVLAILFLSISTLGVIGSMQLYCRCHLHFGRYRCCSWYWHSEFSGQSRRLFRTKYTDMGTTYFFRPFRSLVYYSWNFDDQGRIDLFLHTKDLARQGGHLTDYRLLITNYFPLCIRQ